MMMMIVLFQFISSMQGFFLLLMSPWTCGHPHILHGIVVVFPLILSFSLEVGTVTDPTLGPFVSSKNGSWHLAGVQ